MLITTKVELDLQKSNYPPKVSAVQGDTNTRAVEVILSSGDSPWDIPAGVMVAMRYRKPDMTGGYYDTMPDGTVAWSIRENVITILLAPQILTVAGTVMAQLELMLGNDILATFSMRICVESNPAADVLKSEDYINWVQWMEDEVVRRVNAVLTSGNEFIGPAGPAGIPGLDGEDGGWYEPKVSQVDLYTAEVAFVPSKEGMCSVEAVQLKLPVGKDGYTPVRELDYWTEEDKKEIVSQAQLFLSPVITNCKSGNCIVLTDSANRKMGGLVLYGKTTQNGTPTPENPIPLEYVGESTNVKVCGKNLFALAEPGIVNMSGEEITNTNDLSRRTPYIRCESGEKYAFSKAVQFTDSDDNGMLLFFNKEKRLINSFTGLAYNALSNVVTIPEGVVYFRFVQYGYAVYENADLQIEKSNTVTEYDDCKLQFLAVTIPNGLPGIPVMSAGNYVDESGQYWVCDEVDFAKSVYVKRTILVKLTSNMNWKYSTATKRFYAEIANAKAEASWKQFIGWCSHYPAANQNVDASISYINEGINGIAIRDEQRFSGNMNIFKAWIDANDIWVLTLAQEHIDTPLSAKELAAYTDMHTNYPNTTIINDSGAGMKVEYAADTKLYIDRKFNELTATLVNNG